MLRHSTLSNFGQRVCVRSQRLLQSRAVDESRKSTRTTNNAKFDPKAAAAHARVLQQINPISSEPASQSVGRSAGFAPAGFHSCALVSRQRKHGWLKLEPLYFEFRPCVCVCVKAAKIQWLLCKNLIKTACNKFGGGARNNKNIVWLLRISVAER